MFEKKAEQKIAAVYFVSLAAIMYTLLDGYIDLGVYVTYRHALAWLLVFSAFCCFLVRPNVARMAAAFKACLAFSAPTFVFLVCSLFIWAYNQEEPAIIARGLSSNFFFINHFASVFAAGAFLYMFGEKGIWYNLAALLIPYVFFLGQIMVKNGIEAYMSDLVVLVRTFAGETGDVIQQAEIHELAFCAGAYLIYMMLNYKRFPAYFLFFVILAFCFVSAFKRIAIMAMVLVVPLCLILKVWIRFGNRKTVSKILTLILSAVCVLLLIYVGLVHAGAFEWMEKIGIDTMSRADAYKWANRYYDFSPSFLGRGIGFLTYQLQNDGNYLGLNTIHNDLLQYFVDIGFWGYILWLLSMTIYRAWYFGRGGKTELAVNAAAITLWTLVVSATDNTLRYPLFITVMALLTMGGGFDQRAKEEGRKIFGDHYEIES